MAIFAINSLNFWGCKFPNISQFQRSPCISEAALLPSMEDEPTTPGSVATQAGGTPESTGKLNRWIGCVNDKSQSSELKDSYFHHRFQKEMTCQLELVGWDFQVCQEGLLLYLSESSFHCFDITVESFEKCLSTFSFYHLRCSL